MDIWFDDGGNERLARARRAHYTVMESAPPFLLVLLGYELLGGDATWLLWLGIAYLAGRAIHVYAMFRMPPKNPGRALGGTLSIAATVVAAVLILIRVWG